MRLYKQWHRPMSKWFIKPPCSILYREQPRSTRIVAAYLRPAFSATKQTKLRSNQLRSTSPSFSGHKSYRNKEAPIVIWFNGTVIVYYYRPIQLCTTLFLFCFVSCPCMAINVINGQYNGGLLLDTIMLAQCYYHRGTRLNVMKRFSYLQPMIPPKRFDILPLTGGCSE